MFYPIVRPALFKLDPERAHELTFQQLRFMNGTPTGDVLSPESAVASGHLYGTDL
ncbi:Dihydroorotate dehydrogenase (quinone) [Pantoea agglomerans]|uniref:Dihydroorotate dehydrogenase (Quinone) n=1 Tax=Enterobacter agglomerans TaxID=549 RepID=A0A379AI83_ENTAG|nr:Dihydroorotate dehydrogenase (quinone) [Pantoea agglomerans]